MIQRTGLAVLGVAAAVVLFFALRPADDEDEPGLARSKPRPSAPATTVQTTPKQPVPSEKPSGGVRGVNVRIDVAGGRVDGGIVRARAKRGQRVVVRVTSDAADRVHVHGYDVLRDVAPGRPAQIAFAADITGVFEIELEDAGTQIGELEVRP